MNNESKPNTTPNILPKGLNQVAAVAKSALASDLKYFTAAEVVEFCSAIKLYTLFFTWEPKPLSLVLRRAFSMKSLLTSTVNLEYLLLLKDNNPSVPVYTSISEPATEFAAEHIAKTAVWFSPIYDIESISLLSAKTVNVLKDIISKEKSIVNIKLLLFLVANKNTPPLFVFPYT